jgi:acetylglutamate kinase
VEGVRRDRNDPASLLRAATPDDLEALVASGAVGDGMIPKVMSCLLAVRAGVPRAHILDGRSAHALLLELFSRDGVGTMVSAS